MLGLLRPRGMSKVIGARSGHTCEASGNRGQVMLRWSKTQVHYNLEVGLNPKSFGISQILGLSHKMSRPKRSGHGCSSYSTEWGPKQRPVLISQFFLQHCLSTQTEFEEECYKAGFLFMKCLMMATYWC